MPSVDKNRMSRSLKGSWVLGLKTGCRWHLPRAEVGRHTRGRCARTPARTSSPSSQRPEEPSAEPSWALKNHWTRSPACASITNYYQQSRIRKIHLFGKRSNKGPDKFIFSHIKFQLNYTCTVLYYFGNTGTQFNDSNFFVVFFFYKSGAMTSK